MISLRNHPERAQRYPRESGRYSAAVSADVSLLTGRIPVAKQATLVPRRTIRVSAPRRRVPLDYAGARTVSMTCCMIRRVVTVSPACM